MGCASDAEGLVVVVCASILELVTDAIVWGPKRKPVCDCSVTGISATGFPLEYVEVVNVPSHSRQ